MMGFRFASTSLIPSLQALDAISNWAWSLVNLSGNIISYMNHYVNKLLLPFSSTTSIIGFMLLLTIALQLVSGFFLGWYYIPEPGLVIELREEMFNDTRFGLEVFYMHVRGVDSLFVLTYLHILKKIFIKLCRKIGYEIIDQNNFEIVTSSKKIDEQNSFIFTNQSFRNILTKTLNESTWAENTTIC